MINELYVVEDSKLSPAIPYLKKKYNNDFFNKFKVYQ